MKRCDLIDAKNTADVFFAKATEVLNDKFNQDAALRNTRSVSDVRKLSMKLSKLMVALRKPESREA